MCVCVCVRLDCKSFLALLLAKRYFALYLVPLNTLGYPLTPIHVDIDAHNPPPNKYIHMQTHTYTSQDIPHSHPLYIHMYRYIWIFIPNLAKM